MSIELFANNAVTTVAAAKTAVAQGTTETWTVADSSTFPAASNAVSPPTYFFVFDPAAQTEVIQVTNVSGTTWSVTRGASGTTPVAHAAGFTVYTDIAAATLQNFKQAPGAATSAVTVAGTASETIVAAATLPSFAVVPGAAFAIVAFGTFGTGSSTRPVLTFRLRWGGSGSVGGAYTATGGTTLAQIVSGTNITGFTLTTAVTGSSFDLNGDVSFVDATHIHTSLNAWITGSTLLTTNIGSTVNSSASANSSPTAVTVSGSGPLFLTAQWSVSNAANTLTAVAPLIYRAG